MVEQIKYVNHLNEVIEFGTDGIYVNENDLRDFAWSITKKNEKITAFKMGVAKHAIPIYIMCRTEAEGIEKRNSIFEIFEKDVLSMKHGKIIIGDYYLKCFITGQKKSDYQQSKRYMELKATIQTDLPRWVKETTTTFNYGAGVQGKNLDYNNDFPYDYTSNLLSQVLNNTDFISTNFRMNIYGPCSNPKVTVAGHDYEVNVEFDANEYLTIDSVNKTIVLTHKDGATENCFNKRNRDSYIFEKMPIGISKVSNNGDFKFDITLLEERSEPKWT